MHAKGCGLVAACFPYLSPMDAGSVTLAAVSPRWFMLSESFRDEKMGKGAKIFELWL